MNLTPLWVEFLAKAGFESLHWSMVGQPTAPDTEIMQYANANRLVIFTHDLDFGALLAHQKANQPSVVQIRSQDVLPISVGELVVRALRANRPHLDAGALVTVDPARNRVRLLPI